jgi:hypothetical protein
MENTEDLNKPMQEFFKENNFVVIKKFLDENMAGLIYRYCVNKVKQVDFKSLFAKEEYNVDWDGKFGDEQSPGSYNAYGDVLMDSLLEGGIKAVEGYTGLELIPNYSYWRLYVLGEDLKRHTDRHSCEISITLCIGYNTSNLTSEEDAGYNWPMFVADSAGNELPVHMEPGDMIIYRGVEVEHWREKFKGLNHAQVFLHYNDKNGPFKIANDGRPMLAIPKRFQV